MIGCEVPHQDRRGVALGALARQGIDAFKPLQVWRSERCDALSSAALNRPLRPWASRLSDRLTSAALEASTHARASRAECDAPPIFARHLAALH